MRPQAFNVYVTWTMYAVVGRMAEADGIIEQYKDDVYEAAREISKRFPQDLAPLYRGVLLEPELLRAGVLDPDPRLTFTSFSEDMDVACYFADPTTIVSGFVRSTRPRVDGYIIEHTPKDREEILFHYRWADELPLVKLATMHPHFQDFRLLHQLEWNLQTQKEVILKPLPEGMPVKVWTNYTCPPTHELDERFTPPMFR